MFRNHEKYFDKIIDFGDLYPPNAAARLVKDIRNFKVEVKREILKLIEKLDVGIKNEIQNLKKEIKKGMESEFEVEGSLDLSFNLVEKLDTRIEKEIQNLMIEVKREVLQLSDKIKNEIQKMKLLNENEKGFEEENLNPCDLSLKNEIQNGLKSKIEIRFKRVKEDMEVQRGLDIIEKLDPPTKTPKLGQVLQNVDKSNAVAVVDPKNVAEKVGQEIVQNPAPDPVLEIDQVPMGTGD